MRLIQDFIGKYKDKTAVIVGTGVTADDLDNFRYDDKKHVLIGINRAICLTNKFDFIFFDNLKTYETIKRLENNTKYFLSPLFSMGSCILLPDEDKIYYYVWAWELSNVLKRKHTLDANLLYISWGNVQSALHFASKIGCKTIKFYGCDGQAIDGKFHSDKVLETFGVNTQPEVKLARDYAKTKSKIEYLLKILDLKEYHGHG